jgi:hypothetical protein
MDREEAQNILQLCRPDNPEDRNDPLIAEALELLDQDAELRVWFDEQQALDAEINAELNKIEPPAELKASILVGMRAHAAQSELLIGDVVEDGEQEEDDQVTAFNPWLRPLIGIAAVFVGAAITFLSLKTEETTPQPQLAVNEVSKPTAAAPVIATAGVPNVIEFLAQQISDFNGSKFDKRGDQVGELQNHLASTGMPNPASIPRQLGELETLGCVTFEYEGSKLSMICFKNGQIYHLITANKASFPKDCTPCDKQKIKMFEAKQQAFKVWAEGEQIFILTTEGTEEDIPDFI